jgi:hypothetical protein
MTQRQVETAMTIQYDTFHCLLCRRPGEQLVHPGEIPSLFALQEHLVQDHGVPWEDLFLEPPRSGGSGTAEETEDWRLPPFRVAALGLPQAGSLLRVERARNQPHNHFYFAAAFRTRDLCRFAERAIIEACKQSAHATLCGGEASAGSLPLVVFIARDPGRQPPFALQHAIWTTIHCCQGACIALPGETLDAFLGFVRREALIAQAMSPGEPWAEVTYSGGVPICSDVAPPDGTETDAGHAP